MAKHSLGWIGMGRMGYPMAERLLKAGNSLAIWNRTRAKADPLAQQFKFKEAVAEVKAMQAITEKGKKEKENVQSSLYPLSMLVKTNSLPLATSQRCVPSIPAQASIRPSGLKSTLDTGAAAARKTAISRNCASAVDNARSASAV